jgi:dTDP-4-amino-4,6-dideoxygalactose transaminase
MIFVKNMTYKIEWDDPDVNEEEINAVKESVESGLGSKGKNIKLCEEELEKIIGAKHAILTSNGTTALFASCLAFRELYKVKSIAVPNFSFIASAAAPRFLFDEVKLMDCNLDTWNIDNTSVPDNVDAIMAVDVSGVSCDYDSLKELNLPIIGDSAESIGSKYKNEQVGNQIDIHCFSFQRSKVVTCGEGGLITTNDDTVADFLRSIINHGYSQKKKPWEYKHDNIGLNFRICDTEAAILRVQLKKINAYVEKRKKIAKIYDAAFENVFGLQKIPSYCDTNYFLYGILVDPKKRNMIAENLYSKGISIKCWKSINQQGLHKEWNIHLPYSEYISNTNILLPIHNRLTLDEVDYIINSCLELL